MALQACLRGTLARLLTCPPAALVRLRRLAPRLPCPVYPDSCSYSSCAWRRYICQPQPLPDLAFLRLARCATRLTGSRFVLFFLSPSASPTLAVVSPVLSPVCCQRPARRQDANVAIKQASNKQSTNNKQQTNIKCPYRSRSLAHLPRPAHPFA